MITILGIIQGNQIVIYQIVLFDLKKCQTPERTENRSCSRIFGVRSAPDKIWYILFHAHAQFAGVELM